MKLKNDHLFLGDFASVEDVKSAFSVEDNELNGVYILLAQYEIDGYEGSAFVLFERGGKLYEVNGSHCSCYGLEGQWGPEETSTAALIHRIKKGYLGLYGRATNAFQQELLTILEG